MSLDPHIVLNEEMTPPPKYESYSSGLKNISDTLDEPVLDTIVLSPLQNSSWYLTLSMPNQFCCKLMLSLHNAFHNLCRVWSIVLQSILE